MSAPDREPPKAPEGATTVDELRDRLIDDGPIYSTHLGCEFTPMLEWDYDDGFVLVLEDNDVGGGPSVTIGDAFALAWVNEFGDEAQP